MPRHATRSTPLLYGLYAVLAVCAFVVAVFASWQLYAGMAANFSDAENTSVIGPTSRSIWWALGGFVAGAACALPLAVALAWLWGRCSSSGRGTGLAIGCGAAIALVAWSGFRFPVVHSQRAAVERSALLAQVARGQAEAAERRARADSAEQGELRAKQLIAQMQPASVASTLREAEGADRRATLLALGQELPVFIEHHPWRGLDVTDRTALSTLARSLSGRERYDPDLSGAVGMIVGAEHGLAQSKAAMVECRQHAANSCSWYVAYLAVWLCRTGPACLSEYPALDFATLARDLGEDGNGACQSDPVLKASEVCEQVRLETIRRYATPAPKQ